MSDEPAQPTPIARLLQTMRRLRDPEAGCPWDREQTFQSLTRYTIEEAYEVAEAAEGGDLDRLRDELGDLLLQVVFHAQIADETGAFSFDDVARAITDKLVRRHPHVFDADGQPAHEADRVRDVASVNAIWENAKAKESASENNMEYLASSKRGIGNIPNGMPALLRSDKVSSAAARHGFDWSNARDVIAKIREEVDEVEEALLADAPEQLSAEIGDLMLAVANLSRFVGLDSERTLHASIAKFERRFAAMAARLDADGTTLQDSDIAAMERAWQAIKRAEPRS